MSLDHLTDPLATTSPNQEITNPSGKNTLYHELLSIISGFSERKRQVILRRLGFDGMSESLESIGKDLSVTRERIRQIETLCLHSINRTCSRPLIEKLQKCLTNRTKPLPISQLEQEDEWFKGFSQRPVFLANTIEKLTMGNYHAFTLQGQKIVSRIDFEGWNRVISELLNYLKSHLSDQITQKEVSRIIRRLAVENGIPELATALHESIENKLHFSSRQGKGPKVLCSVGRGISHVLTAILVEASEPLHYTELARRCSARLGRRVEAYVHNTLKGLAYLYGRGLYGTAAHFPIAAREKKEILLASEAIVYEGRMDRQWTCNELLNQLKERHANLPKSLDKYILNIILSESTQLKSVGRLVWIRKDNFQQQTQVSRIDLQEACTAIVAKSERPLSTNKIKEILSKDRGVDKYFTIFPSPKIARIRPNIWGLVERDFLLKKEERQHMLDVLYQQLSARQEGLHITELKVAFKEVGITFPQGFTNYMIMSLSQTDPRFKVRRGQIVGLANWPDGKRTTVKQAIAYIAEHFDFPMTMMELRQAVEEIVKHEVRQPLHRLLENANIIYDDNSNMWVLTPPE